jgi:hypothetical protein
MALGMTVVVPPRVPNINAHRQHSRAFWFVRRIAVSSLCLKRAWRRAAGACHSSQRGLRPAFLQDLLHAAVYRPSCLSAFLRMQLGAEWPQRSNGRLYATIVATIFYGCILLSPRRMRTANFCSALGSPGGAYLDFKRLKPEHLLGPTNLNLFLNRWLYATGQRVLGLT